MSEAEVSVAIAHSKIKRCSICKEEKAADCFGALNAARDGLRKDCRDCRKRESGRRYEKKRASILEYAKEYARGHKEEKAAYDRDYAKKNPEKLATRKRAHKLKFKSHYARMGRDYRREKAEEMRSYFSAYRKEKWKNDVNFRVASRLRSRVRHAVKSQGAGKAKKTIQLLGCSIEELRSHLEKQFKPGMNWDNHTIDGWHIDHIRPLANFSLALPEEQARAFHFSNLQPLWWWENVAKSDTYSPPPEDQKDPEPA